MDLDGEPLSDEDMPGLVDEDGSPVLDPLPDYYSTSEHSDDPEDAISDDGEIIEDGVENDGVAAAASILRLLRMSLGLVMLVLIFAWCRRSPYKAGVAFS